MLKRYFIILFLMITVAIWIIYPSIRNAYLLMDNEVESTYVFDPNGEAQKTSSTKSSGESNSADYEVIGGYGADPADQEKSGE